MRAVIQRVKYASVVIGEKLKSKISQGFLVLLGVGQGDTDEEADLLAGKISRMRVFSDEYGKMNLSVSDIGGSIIVVSQFTLYADCRRGNRPSFTDAAPPAEASRIYEYFVSLLHDRYKISDVQTGEFGADMKVELLNDGPVTIILDSDELKRCRR